MPAFSFEKISPPRPDSPPAPQALPKRRGRFARLVDRLSAIRRKPGRVRGRKARKAKAP